MEMYNPSHPGIVLKNLFLADNNISEAELTLKTGIAREVVSKFLNGECSVTAEMALRLSKAFQTTPELWLDMQTQYDLWHAKQTVNLDDVQAM